MEHPFDQYLEAQDKYRAGDIDGAVASLHKSLGGSGKDSGLIKSSIKKILEKEHPAHNAVLGVLDSETRKRRNG